MKGTDTDFDVVVVGSGFGGAMAAVPLVAKGLRVLLLERGDWVPRGPDNWAPGASLELTEFYSRESPYRVVEGGQADRIGSYSCVGGPSVFYGCVSFRMRERDFDVERAIAGDSGARWPLEYADLEPYYSQAERCLGVAGEPAGDPTEPWRSEPLPQTAAPLARVSERIEAAARSLGLRPFRLPLAINYVAGPRACVACPTCDTFACAISAKNDMATVVLPRLIDRGLVLRPRTVVTGFEHDGARITRVHALDKRTGAHVAFRGRSVVVAAGALGTPHLLLASGLEALNPAGHAVGRFLMRHCNAIVFGVFPRPPDTERRFHKQLGINDYYFGDPDSGVDGKLGCIQQLPTPTAPIVRHYLTGALRAASPVVGPVVERLTGLLVMAEDQPQRGNGVSIDASQTDRHGLPQLVIRHRYSERDERARAALVRRAKQVLRRAGALATYVHPIKTFSHAAGTVRTGTDRSSPLDPDCRFRGLRNLYITDASVMPTVGGVNPSLTISANALRVGTHVASELRSSS